MKDKTDMITMLTDSGESVDFYVLEETRINAVNYLLVTDAPEDQDGECYILKDVSGQQDAEAVYEFVEDDRQHGPDVGPVYPTEGLVNSRFFHGFHEHLSVHVGLILTKGRKMHICINYHSIST